MIKEFSELGLSEKSLRGVKRLAYIEPTPVQAQAIPLALEGRDIIAAAKTGTGKTAAFSLPSMDRLGHVQRGQGPKMLVVTPTRELATQIGEVCETIADATHHRVTVVVGGLSYDPQIKRLRQGVDVLIATPGRLIDLMEQNAIKLNAVEVLVLDEADRMLDMGFWPSIKKITAQIPRERQTLLFSATIDPSIIEHASSLLRDPEFVEIAKRGETADKVDQYVVSVPQSLKVELLKAVLTEKGGQKVIVFARTRSRADSSARRLRRAGFSAEAIHSDRSQAQRKRALENFISGKVSVLVATDVLARGIDVTEVDYVVNLDLPNQPEDYIHRIGRTGRAGTQGFAISFVSPEQEIWLKDIEKLIKREIPTMGIKSFDIEKAEQEIAVKTTHKSTRKDPELAQVVQEYKKTEKKKEAQLVLKQSQKRKSRVSKTNKTRALQSSKMQKTSSEHKRSEVKVFDTSKKKQGSKTASKSGSKDMRPGRARRAAIAKKRSKN